MRVFGIDPGINITGYGIVEKKGQTIIHIDNGLIRPSKNFSFYNKLFEIYESILELAKKYNPDTLALEDIFLAKNFKASIKLGHVRGATMIAASTCKLKIVEYHPNEIKKAVVGTGHADKMQIQKMVKTILNLPQVAAEDASDALAVAICHLYTAHTKTMIETQIKKQKL